MGEGAGKNLPAIRLDDRATCNGHDHDDDRHHNNEDSMTTAVATKPPACELFG